MSSRLYQIEGFEELNRKLKRLDDKVKRREVLRAWRPIARAVASVYRSNIPVGKKPHTRYTIGGGKTTYQPGNLAKSVTVKSVAARYTGGNPQLVIRPDKRGKTADGYYRFMVVPKGFKGSGRGSRRGSAVIVPAAKRQTVQATSGRSSALVEERTARVIQRQIDKLSV